MNRTEPNHGNTSQNRKYFNSPLSYLSTQYGGLVWVWMAEKKLIDSLSFGVSCDVWEFDYFCWEFSRLGRVQGEFESAYTNSLASCGQKFTQTLFSGSFIGIYPENCLTLIRVFYNYFLTDNPDLHAVWTRMWHLIGVIWFMLDLDP